MDVERMLILNPLIMSINIIKYTLKAVNRQKYFDTESYTALLDRNYLLLLISTEDVVAITEV